MMQRRIPFVVQFSILLAVIFSCSASKAQEWQLEKSQNKVKVFSRLTDKHEILATTQVLASPQAFMRLLEDTEHAPEWIDNCLKVTVLSGLNANVKIVHTSFHAPWPLKDRDMVTESTSTTKDEHISIIVRDVGTEYPVQKNTVRMTNIQGQWIIKAIDDQTTEIQYQGSGNPSGNIPEWLANQVLVDSTYQTFINLNQRLKR